MKYQKQQYRIGDYLVEPLAGLIRRVDDPADQTPRHLQPKVMSVLIYLADRQGDVVERDEIIDGVWGRPVTDDVLTRAIHELRTVLDNKSGRSHYIKTIPKIGYQLVADVRSSDSSTGQGSLERRGGEAESASGPAHSRAGRTRLFTVLVIGLLLTIAVLTTSEREPQLEFGENVRVVLAGFENFTSDPQLSNALDVAFRTGIEQSPRISVVPPVAVVSALERMQRKTDAAIDRQTAIEISLREPAKAVIVASIANVGESYRLIGEILEPQSGRTVFTYQSAVVDRNSILLGLDDVVTAIRQESGEALSAIEDNPTALEKVTTANFEALEAYSLGMRMAGVANIELAIPFFEEATRLDPTFAMAFANLGFLQLVVSDDDPEGDWNLQKALEFRERLTRREQLFVEALRVRNQRPSMVKDAWTALTLAYPYYAEGHRNLGNVHIRYDNNFEKSATVLANAVEIADLWNPVAFHNLGFAQLGLGQFDDAVANFQIAWDESEQPMASGLGVALIATRNYDDAAAFLRANQSFPSGSVRQTLEITSAMYFLDQGKFVQAEQMARQAIVTAAGDTGGEQRSLVARCAIHEGVGDRAALSECLTEAKNNELALHEANYFKQRYWPAANLAFLGKIAARNAMYAEAREIQQAIKSRPTGEYYWIESYNSVLEAELLMAEGNHQRAIQLLQSLTTGQSLFQAHESLARAYVLAGNTDQAISEYLWLVDSRGQAFSEQLSRRFGNEFHVLDWALAHIHLGRLYEERGAPEEAERVYETLLEHWANADANAPIIGILNNRLAELNQ